MKSQCLDGTWRLRWSDGQRGHTKHAETPAMDEGVCLHLDGDTARADNA